MRFIFLLLLVSCQTAQNDPDAIYQKDLMIVHESKTLVGFGSLPKESGYRLQIETRKEPELVRISSCHRDVVLRDPGDERFSYVYIPSKGIENKGSCILQIATFDDKGHHQFGAVDFTDDETLEAAVYCNGESYPTGGTSTCQARAGTMQLIEFDTEVQAFATEKCKLPTTEDGHIFRYSVKEGYCVFLFSTDDGLNHRHTTFGYNDIMKR